MSYIKEILRKNGLTPAADKTEGSEGTGNNVNEEGAAADGGEGAQGDPAAPTEGTQEPTPTGTNNPEEGLNTDQVLAFLKKQGIEINSLEEIKKPAEQKPLTEEELRQQEEEKRNAIRAFGLQAGKVTSTELDNYVRESSLPVNAMAYAIFRQSRLDELKKEGVTDAELPTEEDLQAEFNDEYFQYADEKDPKRKRAENRMQREVDEYLKSKYKKVYSLEGEYEAHHSETNRRKEYNQVVEAALATIPDQLKVEIKGQSFTYKVPDEVRQRLKELYLGDAQFNTLKSTGLTKEQLAEAMEKNIRAIELDNIIKEVAEAYGAALLDAQGRGRRAIPASDGGLPAQQPEKKEVEKNPGLKKVLNNPQNRPFIKK
jgi:hypothetical protein